MKLLLILLVLLTGCAAEYQGPVTITKGGKYTFNIKSEDTETPAIIVQTYEPVEIIGSTIIHRGIAIQCPGGTKLTVTNSSFTGLSPRNGKQWGRVLDDYHPQYLVFEHNTINHSGGLHVDHSDQNTRSVIIRYNLIRNTDKRIGDGSAGPEHRAAIQLNTLDHPSGVTGEIAWNVIENLPDSSYVEDNINIGNLVAKAAAPFLVHDNYIKGAYPYPLSISDNSYTGSGITIEGDPAHKTADNVSQFIRVERNQVISTCNAGINVNAGHDITVSENTIISAGMYPDKQPGGFWWAGGAVWNGSKLPADVFRDIKYVNNTIGYVSPGLNKPFENRQDISEGVDLKQNTSLPNPVTLETEEAEWPKFQAKLKANKVVIGRQ